jgi:hypothetical protein
VIRAGASAAGGAIAGAAQKKEDDDATSDARFSTALTHDQIKAGRSACVK